MLSLDAQIGASSYSARRTSQLASDAINWSEQGTGPKAAIVDSGIDLHEDLSANFGLDCRDATVVQRIS